MAEQQLDHRTETFLLATKLHIPEGSGPSVTRSRLFARLDEGRQGKLTLVCAPAGYGKTTLIEDWVRSSDFPASWVSLDAGDNEPVRFWRYFAAAFDGLFPGFMDRVRQLLPLFDREDPEQALLLLLNELDRLPERAVLVLDDFHAIRDERVVQTMVYLIAHMPDAVHLVIVSRTEPEFDLARMKADQSAVQLGAKELRFDEREGGEFLRSCMRLAWDDADTAALVRKTDGWIAGIKLAALSASRAGERAGMPLREFGGDLRQVEHYLLEEVFRQQTEPMQQFLMKCAVLPRWNASICRAVTGNESLAFIESLVRAQLFVVPLDSKGDWYRFHHLFAEFLRKQLEKHASDVIPSLYEKAGQWCRERKLDEEAVDYFLLGRHYHQAVELLEEMAARAVTRGWTALRGWLSSIPNSILLQHPVLYFSYALSLSNSGQGHLAERKLQEAERWYDESSEGWSETDRSKFIGWIHYVRGNTMVFLHNDLNRALDHFRLSESYAPNGVPLIYGSEDAPLQAIDVRSYAIGQGHAAPAVSIPYTMQLADIFKKVNPLFLGRLYIHHGELRYLWNELKEAAHYAMEGMKWVGQIPSGSETARLPGVILQARIKAAEGKREAAKDILHGGMRWMQRMEISRGAQLLEIELARLAFMEGDVVPALLWLERSRHSASDILSVFQLYEYVFVARVLLAANRDDEAAKLLERLQGLAEREMRPIDEAEVLALHSLLLRRQGRKEQSLLKLDEALHKAEANALVRIFTDEGSPMAELLMELIAARQQGLLRGQWASSLDFTRQAVASFGIGESAEAAPLAALLTPREMDVLRHMLDDLNAKQIAERLQIGYETVKTHRARIYGKLGVSGRAKAIERARELGFPFRG